MSRSTINKQLICDSDLLQIEDLSKYATIPFQNISGIANDKLKSAEEPPSEFQIVQSYVVQHIEDGLLELVESNEDNEFENVQTAPSQNSRMVINSPISFITNQFPGTSISRTILLQPPIRERKHSTEEKCERQEKNPGKTLKPATSDVTFNCIKCNDLFSTLTAYRKHLRWHKSLKKFNCTKCSAGYNIENNLKIHVVTAHPNYSDICPICKIKFQRRASLRSHMLVHQIEELHTCDECHSEFATEDYLIKHMETHAINKMSDVDSLVCSYCKLEFKTSQDYRKHISLHIEIKKTIFKGKRTRRRKPDGKFCYPCNFCGKKFAKGCLLERHTRIHTGEKPFVCQYCHKGFTQKGTLQIHMNKHFGLKPFACSLCSAKFNQKGNLRAHISKTHYALKDQKMYKCSQCPCIFKRVATLNGHVTKTHVNQPSNEEDQNTIINDVLNKLSQLKKQKNGDTNKHKMSVPENVASNSTEAIDKAGDTPSLGPEKNHDIFDPSHGLVRVTEGSINGESRRHLVRQIKIGDVRWYLCNYCSNRFKKPSDLIRHVRVHTGERPFQCDKCDATFSLKSTLSNHIKTHAKEGNKCSYCDSTFKNIRSLNAHLRRHELSDAPQCKYICVLCNRVFPSLEKGRLHRVQHKDEISSSQNIIEPILKQPLYETQYGNLKLKPPKTRFPNTGSESPTTRPHCCNICDARFTRLINLKRHLQFHTGDRSFKCHLCPKDFITSYRLKEHLNYHKNIRNYPCTICTKRFVTASLLKRHLIVHNTHKPYMCPYCTKKFKTLLLSRKHINNKHKDEAVAVKLSNLDTNIDNTTTDEVQINNGQGQKNNEGIQNIDTQEISNLPTRCDLPIILNKPAEDDAQNELNCDIVYINLADVQNMSDSVNLNTSAVLLESHVDPNEVISSPNHQNRKLLSSSSLYNVIEDRGNNMTIETHLNNQEQSTLFNNNSQNVSIVNEGASFEFLNNTLIMCIKCEKVYTHADDFQTHTCDTKLDGSMTKTTSIDDIKEDSNNTKKDDGKQEKAIKKTPNKKRTYNCDFCNKVCASKMAFQRHMELVHSDYITKMKVCKFCLKEFKKPSDLKRHLRTHTGERPYQCDLCGKKFSLKSTLESHKKTHDAVQRVIACNVCNALFSSKSSLKVHMLFHSGQKPHPCGFCHLKFRTSANKKAHERNIHLKKDNTSCNTKRKVKVTNVLESVAEEIVKNVRVEGQSNESESVASEASQQIISQDDGAVHEEILPSHLTQTETMETLSLDPSILLQQLQNSNIIITTEDGSGEFVPLNLNGITLLDLKSLGESLPESCDNSITLKLDEPRFEPAENQILPKLLETSQRGELPKTKQQQRVECDICHKLYASKDVLRKHKKKVHGQNRKFPCIKCDKGYDSMEELTKHIKLHTGVRPHVCQYCSNSFSEEQNLKTHIKRIHQKSMEADKKTNALINLQLHLPAELPATHTDTIN